MSAISFPATRENEKTARRKYFHAEAQRIVALSYMKICVLVVALLCVAVLYQDWRLSNKIDSFKPGVVRINDIGRAEVVSYAQYNYTPQAPEIKYFLSTFTKEYYTRMRAVTGADYYLAQLYLSKDYQTALRVADHQHPWLEKFLNGSGEENAVNVTNIDLIDFRKPPYRARVDWDKIFYNRAHVVDHKEHWTTIVVFDVVGPGTDSVRMKYNPLGMTITYFTEDKHMD